ncbi:MAG: HNH endonuclease [Pseudomonadota bacterium]|nr:HNH endonuclease [Pseudomonadota bacterium]
MLVREDREQARLRAKKLVYDEEGELTSIRAAVSNMEAAIEFQRTGPRREPIPDDVKMLVWSRDGGSCVRCGSTERLHFDHVIPVAKGGSNEGANIQLLCQPCNLKKSDKIAF